MYTATSVIKQYTKLILDAEIQDFSDDFHHTMIEELTSTLTKLIRLKCSVFLALRRRTGGNGSNITSPDTITVSSEDIMFRDMASDRAERFRRDFWIFSSAKKLLELYQHRIELLRHNACL